MNINTRKTIGLWLLIGLIMVFVQVILGGITRLTDSGLSITEWNVVKGVLPPMNETDWNIAFDKYKNMANQQFENIHVDMTLTKFKKIFFWEWFHRLWARSMGFVFLFPFLYFLKKKVLSIWLIKKLGVVILLAILVASLGWIMVQSGFDDKQRTWVSAYKLSLHLGVAAYLFYYLFYTCLYVLIDKTTDFHLKKYRIATNIVIGLVFFQILLGGLMAGMHAGIIHPHFPFYNGQNSLLNILSSNSSLSIESIINYESNNYLKAIVQILHRFFAWLILFLSLFFSFKIMKEKISIKLRFGIYFILTIITIQFSLGAFTVINILDKSKAIPLGVLHQAFAFISLIAWAYISFLLNQKRFDVRN